MSLARATASSGTLIEVSSAGLTERCREIYPSPGLLSAFRDAGVDITMASDTHVPKGAGWGIDLVADHARKATTPGVPSLPASTPLGGPR